MLSAPGFHHLHLNSVDPEAAIAFYTRQFPTTSKASWGGLPALQSPNNVLILFTKVATPPPTAPQTAIWHFGWHVTDTRERRDVYQSRPDVTLVPLYTGDDDGAVFVSSDTWPGTGGVLGLTKAQIAEARAQGVQPTRTRRLRVHGGSRPGPGGVRRQPSGRALQPRALLPGGSVLRPALVPAAPQRATLRRAHQPPPR